MLKESEINYYLLSAWISKEEWIKLYNKDIEFNEYFFSKEREYSTHSIYSNDIKKVKYSILKKGDMWQVSNKEENITVIYEKHQYYNIHEHLSKYFNDMKVDYFNKYKLYYKLKNIVK